MSTGFISGGANWTYPILQQINRQGDIMMYGDQANRQNALMARQNQIADQQVKMNAFALDEKKNAAALAERHRNAFSKAWNAMDQAGMPYEPQTFAKLYAAAGGSPEMALKILEDQSKGMVKIGAEESLYSPYTGKTITSGAGKRPTEAWSASYFQTHGKWPTPEEVQAHENEKARAGSQTINMPKIELGRETGLVDAAVKVLPEARKEATAARVSMNRIDQALDILEKHGDTVAGVPGVFRRYLAPFAKTIGMDVDKATDAELLNSLLTEGAGGLRAQVVGPGPVTNFEQGILKQVSGGKMSYAQGVAAVLNHHRENLASVVDNYNEQVKSISGIKGYENAANVFKAIPYKTREKKQSAAPQKVVKREGIYNGKKVVEYEDESIEYAY